MKGVGGEWAKVTGEDCVGGESGRVELFVCMRVGVVRGSKMKVDALADVSARLTHESHAHTACSSARDCAERGLECRDN